MTEKIQKILANAGIGSRRYIESLILSGKIVINGKVAQIGGRITCQDKVVVDGHHIKLAKSQEQKSRFLIYHKPEGEICTRQDPEGRPTIFDRLPYIRHGRWISVGRLDFNTSGLLLLTNNGEIANKLMHPSSEFEREYAVRIHGTVNQSILTNLKKGIRLEDGMAKFHQIEDAGGKGTNHWYHVVVKEGRNRLVRRLWESQDLTVSRLIRIRFGHIALPNSLKQGHCLELTEEEIEMIIN